MKPGRFRNTVMAILALVVAPPSFATGDSRTNSDAEVEVVVLIHGLGRNIDAMAKMAETLEIAGYKVHRVGYSSFYNSPEDMIEEVTTKINSCCIDAATKLHFVGHSLGGLMIRAYLQETMPPNLGHTVLMGTPNGGTEFADRYQHNALIKILMPTALALGTDEQSLPNRLKPPYYPVGVIAGVAGEDDNEDVLPGPDDGLVTVESAKLEGMSDFIQLELRHYMLRSDDKAAKQVLAFLKDGKFVHDYGQPIALN